MHKTYNNNYMHQVSNIKIRFFESILIEYLIDFTFVYEAYTFKNSLYCYCFAENHSEYHFEIICEIHYSLILNFHRLIYNVYTMNSVLIVNKRQHIESFVSEFAADPRKTVIIYSIFWGKCFIR